MTKAMKKPGRWKPGESGNPKGRKSGTGEVARLRAVIQESIPSIIDQLVSRALEGDAQAARLLLERVMAPVKASSATVDLPGVVKAVDLSGKAQATLEAIAKGELPPDIGAALVAAIGQTARVLEVDELMRRIEALEAAGKP